jgi:transposase
MIPLSFADQIQPGSFEYTLSEVIDSIDLSLFSDRYRNDTSGAPAYDPAILLKIVLYAYSRGINTSRRIERCCRESVMFMALSADSHPDHSTIAAFVSGMHKEIVTIFQSVLRICIELDLVEGSMFAVDGCKLSSNASKEWSGTKDDLRKKRDKLIAAIDYMVDRHIEKDARGESDEQDEGAIQKRIDKARAKIAKLDKWIEENEDKKGARGRVKQSNITDNESAKMKSSRGVIQGYNGLAVVDDKKQVVIHAEAHGSADDGALLGSCITGAKHNLQKTDWPPNPLVGCRILADTAFHTIENCALLESEDIDGYVPDCNFRKRDPRFATAKRHDPAAKKRASRYEQSDFTYDKKNDMYICPMGKCLRYYMYVKNHDGRYRGRRYQADAADCKACKSRLRCLKGENVHARQFMVIEGTISKGAEAVVAMKSKVDTARGRELYSKRMGIVEPVFGNIVGCKKLDRFTLRGNQKVNIQWNLYSLVHNIGKIWQCGAPVPA